MLKINTANTIHKITIFKFRGLLNLISTSKKTMIDKIMMDTSKDLDIRVNKSKLYNNEEFISIGF